MEDLAKEHTAGNVHGVLFIKSGARAHDLNKFLSAFQPLQPKSTQQAATECA